MTAQERVEIHRRLTEAEQNVGALRADVAAMTSSLGDMRRLVLDAVTRRQEGTRAPAEA